MIGLDPSVSAERSHRSSDARRCLLVAFRFPPVASAGVFRMVRFVKYLPEFGWNPIVLTTAPHALGERCDEGLLKQIPPSTRVVRTGLWLPADALGRARRRLRGAREQRSTTEDRNGAEEAAASSPVPSPSVLHRMVDVLLQTPDDKAWWFWPAVWAGLRIIRTDSPRVILTTGPPHSTHVIGMALSRLTGVPLVLDLRDPWARTPWGPRKADPLAHKMVVRLERTAVHAAARVVLNTPRLRNDFIAEYGAGAARRFALIPNGYDPDLLTEVDDLVRQHGRSDIDTMSVVHVGSLYKGRDPVPVLEAIAKLRREGLPVTFRQVGACASEFTPERDVHRLQLNGAAVFEGAVPHQVALARTAAADILLAIQPGTGLQVPGKLFEMMLFGKPIIGIVDEGATADLLREYRLGATVQAGDVDGLARAIRGALERRTESAVDRGDALRHFDGRRLTGELAALFDQLG